MSKLFDKKTFIKFNATIMLSKPQILTFPKESFSKKLITKENIHIY